MSSTEQLPSMKFPPDRGCPVDHPDFHADLREQGPVLRVRLPSGQTAWVITQHAEARAILSDPRISGDPTKPGTPVLLPNTPRQEENLPGFFIDQDGPAHARLRRMLISEFSVRRINAMRPTIQRVVDDAIDNLVLEGSPADLVPEFALPIPSLVICNLLGVPYADHDHFQSRTRVLVNFSSTPEARRTAVDEMRQYLRDLVGEKDKEPTDDLLGRLVLEQVRTDALDLDELAGMAFLLLVAGHETTANMIPLGIVDLLRHPDQLAALRADPTLLSGTVEEMLRYHTIADLATADRSALADIEIGGQLIRAGEGIIVLGSAANLDERAFDSPQEFDIRRSARQHIAFGYGVHQCLGQNLARVELEIAFGTLFDRLPGLRLAVPAEDLRYKDGAGVVGLAELPVTW